MPLGQLKKIARRMNVVGAGCQTVNGPSVIAQSSAALVRTPGLHGVLKALKAFREACSNGEIKLSPSILAWRLTLRSTLGFREKMWQRSKKAGRRGAAPRGPCFRAPAPPPPGGGQALGSRDRGAPAEAGWAMCGCML